MMFDRRGSGGFRSYGRRPSFGGRDYDMPKPIKVGEEYDVEIAEVGSKGDGIARVKNFVVFVTGSKKGEKVKIKITDVRDRFATAEKVGAASEAAPQAEAATETAGTEASKTSESSEASETSEASEEKTEEEVEEAAEEELGEAAEEEASEGETEGEE
jgi:predicted RNA-binding protein with TRAM domain